MAANSRRRKVLFWVAGLTCLILLFLLASPLWFPWALKTLAPHYGVNIGSYERHGYNRLVLNDITFHRNTIDVRARLVEIPQPLAWLWLTQFRTKDSTEGAVVVTDWQFHVAEHERTNAAKALAYSIVEKTDRAATPLEEWFPFTVLRNGTISFGTNEIRTADTVWNNGFLHGDFSTPELPFDATYRLNLSRRGQIGLQAKIPALQLETDLHAAKSADQLSVDGIILWQTNRADITSQFVREGSLPVRATIHAPSVRLPASLVGLINYEDIVSSISADWNGTNYLVDISSSSHSLNESFPPVNAVVRARGDTNSIRLETVDITLPWVHAELSKNVDVSFKGRLLSDLAEFKIVANLSEQPFIKARGKVSGQVFLRPSASLYPDATFSLTVDQFGFSRYTAPHVEAEGAFAWPELKLKHFAWDIFEKTRASGKGVVDLEKEFIKSADIRLEGTLPPKTVPQHISIGNVLATAHLSGPFRNLSHEGEIKVAGFRMPHVNPIKVEARWEGEELNFKTINATASISNTLVHLSGSAVFSTNDGTVALRNLELTTNNASALTLQQPSEIQLRKAKDLNWQVAVTPLELKGAAGDLSFAGTLQWPDRGDVSLSFNRMNIRLLSAFITNQFAAGGVDSLHFSGGWTNSPLNFSLAGSGFYNPPEDLPLKMQVDCSGNASGVRIRGLHVATAKKTIVAAQGTLPIRIELAHPKDIVRVASDEPIDFQAITEPNQAFWKRFTKVSKLKLDQPDVSLKISGTLNKPIADISATAKGVEWLGAKQRLPRITDLRAKIRADRTRLRLEPLNFKVEGQPVLVEAEMPIDESTKEWKKAFDWHKGSGRVVIQQAQVNPFLRFFPAVLGPSGTIDLNVTFSPGAKMNGDLKLRGLETKPLGTIGAVRELQAELKLTESRVQVANAFGILGGEKVGLSGFINFAETAPNKLPIFDLNIAGKNIPLTRQPDLIVRADIELNALNTRTNQQPSLNGLVQFNESFFLGDLKMLLPGRVSRPRDRPPYFSVEAEPFAKWGVDVRLIGDNFMRIRTPLFNGSISANWRIRGTLREPTALGEMKIESGQIQFPFSNLRVQQGQIFITSEDPYRPQIYAIATSRTFGYDVQLNITGPADKPVIDFTSTPSLTSEQIVLMLTAGEVPRRQGGGFSAQQRAGRLGLFLGRSLLSRFASEEGAERLTITSGENLTQEGRETYALQFKISDRISIVGEYDRFGAWNGGIKWRVYYR